MAKILEIPATHVTFTREPLTGEFCQTTKVVDISEDCPAVPPYICLLLYTNVNGRPTVQIAYGISKPDEKRINFTIADLDEWMCQPPRTDFFGFWASFLGIDNRELRNLIRLNAP